MDFSAVLVFYCLIYSAKALSLGDYYSNVEARFESLENEIRVILQKMENIGTDVELLKNAKKETNNASGKYQTAVGFTASVEIESETKCQPDQPVEYKHVLSNIGNVYDAEDSSFTVSTAGVYLFIITASGMDTTKPTVTIMRNSNDLVGARAHGHSGSAGTHSASNSIVIHCAVGDRLWLKCTASSEGSLYDNAISHPNTFTGYLLSADA